MRSDYDAFGLGASPSAMTLQAFTQLLGDTLRATPELQMAWVAAELSDVRSSGGHCYMELIEKNDAGQTVAKMRATVWASTYARLRQKFERATGRAFVGGLKVLLCGSASHHNLYGLSFNVIDVDPSYTLGDMERLRREILQKLHAEGVLEANKQLPLAEAPQRIAIISAEGAAGYGDFMHQLCGNAQGFVFYTALYGAVMQGERTSASVREALAQVEMSIDFWDCVVIIRGGGATSDLNGFDDLELARAVATFPIPIIVGIGHERDRTVLDEIAHTRVKTPTAGAAFLIDRLQSAYERTIQLTRDIASYVYQRSEGEKRNLASFEAMLPALVKTRLAEASARLNFLGARVPVAAGAVVERAKARLAAASQVAAHAGKSRISSELQNLNLRKDALQKASGQAIGMAAQRLEKAEALIDALSPKRTLERGYAVVRVAGKAIRYPDEAPEGTNLTIELAKGTLEASALSAHNKNSK